MKHFSTVLAAAAAAAAAARPAALPPPRVDEAHVDLLLSRLLEKAREGRKDPDAPAFSIGAWDARDRVHNATWARVRERLEQLGLEVIARRCMVGVRELPCEIFVTYDSLEHAAQRIERERAQHLAAIRTAWAERFGDAGAVTIHPGHFGPVLTFAGPEPDAADAEWFSERGRLAGRPTWTSGTDFYDHDPDELVARALAEIKVPVWTFAAVAGLWEAVGGTLERGRGFWDKGDMEPGPTLIFRLRDAQKTYLVESVASLPAEVLVDEVLRDGIWTTPAESPPAPAEQEEQDDQAEEETPEQAPSKASSAPRQQPRRRGHGDQR
jgi:hypothetical protein